MHLSYKDLLNKMEYNLGNRFGGYSIELAEYYNKIVGNIQPGIYTAISGFPGSGATSFVLQNYVLGVLIQWYMTDPIERKPLKIHVVLMGNTAMKVLEQLTCTYIKLVENRVIDIPTLTNQKGSKYNLGSDKSMLDLLKDASKFFDEILGNEILEFHDKAKTQVDISSIISDTLSKWGKDSKKDDAFRIKPEYAEGLCMCVIDKLDNLVATNDGFGTMSNKEMHEKMDAELSRLIRKYQENLNVVAIVPMSSGLIRGPKDTEPKQSQLGTYVKGCHRGVILYDPIEHGNRGIYYDDHQKFIGPKSGLRLLRYWCVVRNTEGQDNAKKSMFFFPGVGYMIENPLKNGYVDSVEEVERVLMNNKYCPYYNLTVEND